MTESGAEALARIGAAVEAEGYGRSGLTDPAGHPALADDLALVLPCLGSSVEGNDRLRAALLPPSLVSRVRRVVARFA
jgi:hypothetical protein